MVAAKKFESPSEGAAEGGRSGSEEPSGSKRCGGNSAAPERSAGATCGERNRTKRRRSLWVFRKMGSDLFKQTPNLKKKRLFSSRFFFRFGPSENRTRD